ncbi:hypothetical protein ABZP36_024499 [Zizania latifolia]
MLPRSQSIFHLGEDGCAHCHRGGSLVAAAMSGGGRGASAGRRVRDRLDVGLQILVHSQHHHHSRHAHGNAANIVLKQMVWPRAAAGSHGAVVSCSFLKACSLCRRELSPTKDVYMYRGDQGFCSEECRWQQIVIDEARESDAAVVRPERRGLARHRSPHRTAAPSRVGRPMKTLAVA